MLKTGGFPSSLICEIGKGVGKGVGSLFFDSKSLCSDEQGIA